MKKLTKNEEIKVLDKEQAIDLLIKDDVDVIQQAMAEKDYEYLSCLLEFGIKGFVYWSKKKLEMELNDRFGKQSYSYKVK